jgi:hypothetical protein
MMRTRAIFFSICDRIAGLHASGGSEVKIISAAESHAAAI